MRDFHSRFTADAVKALLRLIPALAWMLCLESRAKSSLATSASANAASDEDLLIPCLKWRSSGISSIHATFDRSRLSGSATPREAKAGSISCHVQVPEKKILNGANVGTRADSPAQGQHSLE